jgi:hypothetical protein
MDDIVPPSTEHYVSHGVLVRHLILDLVIVVKDHISSLLFCQSAAHGVKQSTYV